jgi:hypothetical protein
MPAPSTVDEGSRPDFLHPSHRRPRFNILLQATMSRAFPDKDFHG